MTTSPGLASSDYLDDRLFKFKVLMWNDDDRIVQIPRGAIKELVINENVFDWYHSGHLVINNPRNALERASKKYIKQQEIDVLPYRFRNDGRDYLYISIDVPVQDDVRSAEGLDNEVYTMELVMSVYDTQDQPSDDINNKTKKLSFWDYRHQLMTETNLWWSTAHAVKRQSELETYNNLYLTRDSNRTVYTGDAIKDLITQCLQTTSHQPKFEADFSKGGEKLFYTSPAASRVSDDLKYLLEHHVHDAASADPCMLRVDRYTDEWSLRPVTNIFHRAYMGAGEPGDLQLDQFVLSDEALIENINTSVVRTPDVNYAMNNMVSPDNSVNNFTFLEQSARLNNEMLNTTLVHMYDNTTKQFNTHMEHSDIDQVRKYIKERVIDKMLGGEGGPDTTMVLNRIVKENRNVKHQFTVTATQVRDHMFGRNKTVMYNLLAGNTIEFNTRGSTTRQSGKFISMTRTGGGDINEFDDKILGQYFVTSVDHVIDANGYNNQIIATKPYVFKNQNFNELVT